MTKANLLGRKIIAVSDGRRITIPKNFYNSLSFGDRVECFVRGNELVIRPTSRGFEDFSDLIEVELSAEGLKGEDFTTALAARKAELKQSLQAMLADAKKAAQGKGEYFTAAEIFGGE